MDESTPETGPKVGLPSTTSQGGPDMTREVPTGGVTPAPEDLKPEDQPGYREAKAAEREAIGGTRPKQEGSFGFAQYARKKVPEGPFGETTVRLHHPEPPPEGPWGPERPGERRFLETPDQVAAGGIEEMMRRGYVETEILGARPGGVRPEYRGGEWTGTVAGESVGQETDAIEFEVEKYGETIFSAEAVWQEWDALSVQKMLRNQIFRRGRLLQTLPRHLQQQFNYRRGLNVQEITTWLIAEEKASLTRMEEPFKEIDPEALIRERERSTRMTEEQKKELRERVKKENEWRKEDKEREGDELFRRIAEYRQDLKKVKEAVDKGHPLDIDSLESEVKRLEVGTLVPGGIAEFDAKSAERLVQLYEEAVNVYKGFIARVAFFSDYKLKQSVRTNEERYLLGLYTSARAAPKDWHYVNAVERGPVAEGEVEQRFILSEAAAELINIAEGEGVIPWEGRDLNKIRLAIIRGDRAEAEKEKIMQEIRTMPDIRARKRRLEKVKETLELLDMKIDRREVAVSEQPDAYIEALVRMEDGEYRKRARRELAEIEEGMELELIDPEEVQEKIKELTDLDKLKEQALADLPPAVKARIEEEVTKEVEEAIKSGKVREEDKAGEIAKRRDQKTDQLTTDIARHWRVFGAKEIVIGNPNHPDSLSHIWGNPMKGGDPDLMVARITNTVRKRINQQIRDGKLEGRELAEGEDWRVRTEVYLAYAMLMGMDVYAHYMPFGLLIGATPEAREKMSKLMAEQRGIEYDGSKTFYTEVLVPEYIQMALRRGEYATPLSEDVHAKDGVYGIPLALGTRQLHKIKAKGDPKSDAGPFSKIGADPGLLVDMLHYYHVRYKKKVTAINEKTGNLEPGMATFTISIWDLWRKHGLRFDEAITVLGKKKFSHPKVERGRKMDVFSSEIPDIEPYRNTSAHVYPILQLAMNNDFVALAKEIEGKGAKQYLLRTLTDHMEAGPEITWQIKGVSGRRVHRSKKDGKLYWVEGDDLRRIVTQWFIGNLLGSNGTSITKTDETDGHRESTNPVDWFKTPVYTTTYSTTDQVRGWTRVLIENAEDAKIMAQGSKVKLHSGQSLYEFSKALLRTYLRKWRLAATLRRFTKPQDFYIADKNNDTEPVQPITPIQVEFLDKVGIQYPLAA